MKGLYKYLAPFAPDYSGAVSVLFEMGGLIVVCDAGGCTGNICGYDEPRWYNSKSALFSAGLRDLDTIFGRDDILLDKIVDAVSQIACELVVFVGTPAPAVIGTDFKALIRAAKQRIALPVLAIDTNGMDLYDRGQEKAYMNLFQTFATAREKDTSGIGVIGATPLDLPNKESFLRLAARLQSVGCGETVCYGMGAGVEEIKTAANVCCNLVVSPSGLKAARWLRERYGTPYIAGFPFAANSAKALAAKIEMIVNGMDTPEKVAVTKEENGGVLIIHQQIFANAVRDHLRAQYRYNNIDVASWFMLDEEFIEPGDSCLREETDLSALLAKRRYKAVIGDPLFKRAISDWQGEYIDLPHYAVSGRLFSDSLNEHDCLAPLNQYFSAHMT